MRVYKLTSPLSSSLINPAASWCLYQEIFSGTSKLTTSSKLERIISATLPKICCPFIIPVMTHHSPGQSLEIILPPASGHQVPSALLLPTFARLPTPPLLTAQSRTPSSATFHSALFQLVDLSWWKMEADQMLVTQPGHRAHSYEDFSFSSCSEGYF